MNMVALIPARAGSKRVPGKNTRLLAGHPLLAYTIAAAQQSGIFGSIMVCTDDRTAHDVAEHYGVWMIYVRPLSSDDEPDITWVSRALHDTRRQEHDAFAILRPTSPFRSAEHIRQAYARFCQLGESIDSLRAVRPVTEHPGKMWSIFDVSNVERGVTTKQWQEMRPAMLCSNNDLADIAPWHSQPTQALPPYYVQTSSLEMAWTRVIHDTHTIAGTNIAPWIVTDANGFTIDTESDWREAERLVASGEATLPSVALAGVSAATAPQ